MIAPIIQVDYEALRKLIEKFEGEGTEIQKVQQQVSRLVENLQSGGWQGEGARAFFDEMDSEIFPGVTRLCTALEESSRVTTQMMVVIQQAEEEAAGRFRDGGSGVDGTESGRQDKTNDQLMVKDPAEVFSKRNMKSYINKHFKGEDDRNLNNLMENLLRANPADTAYINHLLTSIAEIRGVDPAVLINQYPKYLNLLSNAGGSGEINLLVHPNFMGSTSSLRYGSVVGEVFGIDPVFGALLNPTGGLVGPSNYAYAAGDNDPLSYHGSFHDAAGYLYNDLQLGSGYTYIGWSLLPTSSALSGQYSGIQWWTSQMGLSSYLPDFLPDPLESSLVETETAFRMLDTLKNLSPISLPGKIFKEIL